MHQSIATIDSPEFLNLQPLDINPLMSKCEIKVLYVGANRNRTFISKQVAAEIGKTLRGAPIVGYYKQKTEDFADDLKRFPGIITPDCSLYVDAPLVVQLTSIYLNRAVGYYLRKQGLCVIPNIRWGDERTFTTEVFRDKVAFLGVDKHSIVSIGTFGQIKGAESKRIFRDGLIAMLEELEPETVLVYGAMPKSIFGDLHNRTKFIQYPDWITRIKNETKK